jgi:hypothetical protein
MHPARSDSSRIYRGDDHREPDCLSVSLGAAVRQGQPSGRRESPRTETKGQTTTMAFRLARIGRQRDKKTQAMVIICPADFRAVK